MSSTQDFLDILQAVTVDCKDNGECFTVTDRVAVIERLLGESAYKLISMVPWVEFTGFNINVFDEGKFLLPIFTMGKFFERDGKRLLPLAIQVHHAVCDGYHVGVFVEKLQGYIDQF